MDGAIGFHEPLMIITRGHKPGLKGPDKGLQQRTLQSFGSGSRSSFPSCACQFIFFGASGSVQLFEAPPRQRYQLQGSLFA